ncbi:MAG: PEP-CTERM sorting domain-containing protein [Methylococcaceae bacterium]|nr:PEP-CTERM sorting domain-containing protein [Methylococcaceae bacterium]
MLYLKSILAAIIVCLVAAHPTLASEVTHYPGIPGTEPAWDQYVFDFRAFPLGMETGFSETIGDLTITYTAPDYPFVFKTVDSRSIPSRPSPFPLLLGEASPSVLGISFSHPVFGIGIEYVPLGPGSIQMDLMSGGIGGSVVGPRSESGAIPPGLIYPEGFINRLPLCVCDNYFDAVLLSDMTDPTFAVRKIVVVKKVPEPPTPAMFGAGLAVLAALRRRKSARSVRG